MVPGGGILRPQVVVPQWALAHATARELMLRHEAEHIRARDPHFVRRGDFAGVVSGTPVSGSSFDACDWRSKRIAINASCAACAAARIRNAVTVGATARRPLAVSLAERRPFLERRIRAMTTPRPAIRASYRCFTLAAVVVATAAWVAPRPRHSRCARQRRPQAPRSADARRHAQSAVDTSSPQLKIRRRGAHGSSLKGARARIDGRTGRYRAAADLACPSSSFARSSRCITPMFNGDPTANL
jgi:hypothetical protein